MCIRDRYQRRVRGVQLLLQMVLEKLGNSELGVVLDNGSHTLKYGVTGSDQPQGEFPKNDSADYASGPMVPEWPVERGSVTDWDVLEKVWSYGFVRSGFKGYDQQIPVGVVTAMDNLRDTKELVRMAELLFETFEVGSVRFDAQPMAGLYASGRTTGVGVSVGHGLTQVLPVFNGIPLSKHFTDCAQQSALGAADVDAYLLARHEELGMLDRFDLARMKAELCSVPEFLHKQSTFLESRGHKDVELPDGSLVELGAAAWQGAELLFDPKIAGSLRADLDWQQICTTGGVPDMVAACVGQVPAYHSGDYNCGDWRVEMSNCLALQYSHRGQTGEAQVVRELCRNICLFGGGSMTTGFVERMNQQMRAQGPPGLDIKVCGAGDRSRQEWIGSSIFMSLSSVTGITRANYLEYGPRAAESFALGDNMLLQEDYELIPPTISSFPTAALTIEGGSPTKGDMSAGKAVEFNSQDLAHAEQAVLFKHPSPMWTALKFIGQSEEQPARCVIKVGPVLRELPGQQDKHVPMALVDQEDGPAHLFQRAPALQVLHDKLVNAGVEVIYRNEPGPEHAYKVLFLDGTGFEFAENNSMCFQGIKQAFTRFSTLHGSLPGAPNLSDMYENSQRLTELQLAIFETIDKDPREYVPASYFESLSAVKETWAACKHHYKIREQDS
eukprot:TRINITY_DN17347_c0_g1_i1.p1 TRINITY_DN17347_c0_g1~~TRINITY_DN17347_c0_g1_i1.p1  ORF type:complete len:669 (+),score=117.78 TRINITY_DN17347_c0_g1_i1:188-2194(+)